MSINKIISLGSGITYTLDVLNSSIRIAKETQYISNGALVTAREPLLFGHRSLSTPVSSLPSDFAVDFSRMNMVSFLTLPIYRNKLVSASLNISSTSIPLYASTFNVNITISSTPNAPIPATYPDALNLNRYSQTVSGSVSAGTATFNVTPLLNYLTTLPTWIPGNRVALFLDAPTSGNQMVRVSVDSSYLSVNYNPVIPSSPGNLEVTPGFQQLFVSWTPPLDDGGSTVLDYIVEYRLLGTDNDVPVGDWVIAKTATITTVSIDNLSNKSRYVVRVRARNAMGLGSYSNTSSAIQPQAGAAPRVSSTYNDANYTRIRLRRDTASSWSGVNPVLGLGEAGYETDTRFLKVGDNNTSWNDLGYVKVPNSSIQFPPPPPVNLIVGDGRFGTINPRIICNLSESELLNISATNGITAVYNNVYKSLVLSLTQTYNPIYSGTLYSPRASGQPGNVAYDDQWMYVCVQDNFWKKLPLEQYWFDPTTISVSNTSGTYPSATNIAFSGSHIIVETDGDPYPAKAGYNLVNDGLTTRLGFFGSYTIEDQTFKHIFRYRGPSYSSNPQPIGSGVLGVMTNGSFFASPLNSPNKIDIFQAPAGFRFNKVFFSDYFRIDPCGGEVVFDRSYRYLHGKFLTSCWNNSLFINSNTYYGSTMFNSDNFRHSDGHSKILGFCFDGYPVYGPFGYTVPTNPNSGVSLMTSSYVTKTTDNHRPVNWKFDNALVVNDINFMLSAGAFVEDFDFYEGSGTLDQYNGRFAVTPEYPEGVYAYYLSFSDSSLAIPKYPYIVGPYSRQQRPI